MKWIPYICAALIALMAATTPVAAQSDNVDVVRTRDGAMVRGTLIESVPESYVVLLLATGEARRIEAADIVSIDTVRPAPAADAEPDAARPPGFDTSGSSVRVGVTSHAQGTTLHLRGGAQSGSVRLCTAPCTLELNPGAYAFAVENARGRVRNAGGEIDIAHDGQLDVRYRSRRGLRIGLLSTAATLIVIGIPVMVVGIRNYDECSEFSSDGCALGGFFSGVSLVAAGGAIGLGAAFAWDRGRVTYVPSF